MFIHPLGNNKALMGAMHCILKWVDGLLEEGTARMPDYLPSMYHDRCQNRPMELEAIYAAPLAAAAQQGVSMPCTEMLYRLLRFLEQRNGA